MRRVAASWLRSNRFVHDEEKKKSDENREENRVRDLGYFWADVPGRS